MTAHQWYVMAIAWESKHYNFIYNVLWPDINDRKWRGLDEAVEELVALPDGGMGIYAQMMMEVGE